MGVKLKKYKGKWYLFIDYNGKRKAKCLGTDRKLAESIKRQVEAKLVLGDLGVFGTEEQKLPTFRTYADTWMKDYARVECKTSTADGYEGVLRQYLRPRFASHRLDEITRDQIKSMINELVAKNLSRSTIRNALCVIRGMFNQAIEGGLLDFNPAARLGRFTRTAKSAQSKGVSLTAEEVQTFLDAASEICPEYYPLFLCCGPGLVCGVENSFRCAGVTCSLARTRTIQIVSSWSNTTTCAESTRTRRARKLGV
jgi:integrase